LSGERLTAQFGDNRVYGLIDDWYVFNFTKPELNVRRTVCLDILAGRFNHLWRHIDTNDPTGCTNFPCGEETVKATTGSEIENGVSLLKTGDRSRITATETQIRIRADGGEVVVRVANFA
jgi:hypothetical protein